MAQIADEPPETSPEDMDKVARDNINALVLAMENMENVPDIVSLFAAAKNGKLNIQGGKSGEMTNDFNENDFVQSTADNLANEGFALKPFGAIGRVMEIIELVGFPTGRRKKEIAKRVLQRLIIQGKDDDSAKQLSLAIGSAVIDSLAALSRRIHIDHTSYMQKDVPSPIRFRMHGNGSPINLPSSLHHQSGSGLAEVLAEIEGPTKSLNVCCGWFRCKTERR